MKINWNATLYNIETYYKTNKTKISKETFIKILKEKDQNISYSTSCIKFGITLSYFYHLTSCIKIIYFNPIDFKQVQKDYMLGYTTKELSKKYNIPISQIQKRISFITCNQFVFDNINCEETAYWLGFIFADGYVSNHNAFELSLALIDIDHLYKFNKFIKGRQGKVKQGTSKCNNKIFQRCRWNFTNKHFVDTLISYGCVPNKSLILKFPIELFKDDVLLFAFIRGYFDGDGTLTFRKHAHCVVPSIKIIGTKDFLKTMQTVLLKNNINSSIYTCNRNINVNSLEIKINSVKSFLNLIYKNASIYLNRKYERFRIFQFHNFAVPNGNIKDYDWAISVKV